jgi:O-antigen/teichoic acid export membrane protein
MFAFHVVLSREFGLARYGALYTVISIATFIGTMGSILTIIVARLVAELRDEPQRLALLCGSSLRKSAYIGALICVVVAAFTVPISHFLRISELSVVFLLAVYAGTQIALAALRGVLQGLQEFARLALSLILEALVRTGLAIVMALYGLGVVSSVGAYVLGALLAVGFSFGAVFRSTRIHFGRARLSTSRVMNLSFGAAFSVLAIAALSTVDVLLVRHFFDNVSSSVYGALSLAGKMVYFAVGFLPTVLLPKATSNALSGAKPLKILLPATLLIIVLSCIALGAFWLFPVWIINVLTGGQYAAAAHYLFRYGLAMAFLGASNAFVAYRIGVGDFRFIPAALVLVVSEAAVITMFHSTLDQVVTIVVAVNAAVLAVVLYGLGRKPTFTVGEFQPDPALIAEEVQAH